MSPEWAAWDELCFAGFLIRFIGQISAFLFHNHHWLDIKLNLFDTFIYNSCFFSLPLFPV